MPYYISHFIKLNPLFDIDLFLGPLTWKRPYLKLTSTNGRRKTSHQNMTKVSLETLRKPQCLCNPQCFPCSVKFGRHTCKSIHSSNISRIQFVEEEKKLLKGISLLSLFRIIQIKLDRKRLPREHASV